MSPYYAGLFFRGEGGNASSFGTIQKEQTQTIFVKQEHNPSNVEDDVEHAITSTYAPIPLWTGGSAENLNSLNFRQTTDEIRPRNQAIRIWIRIK